MTKGGNRRRAIRARMSTQAESYSEARTAVLGPLEPLQQSLAQLWPLDRAFPPEDVDPELVDDGWTFLTPRSVAVLRTTFLYLADQIREDAARLDGRPVEESLDLGILDEFPRLVWRQPPEWWERMARAAEDLADDLANGRPSEPRCPAEEALHHVAMGTVESVRAMMWNRLGDLPASPRDFDFESFHDIALQDEDILMLWEDDREGIETPTHPLNALLRMGDYRPDAWFKCFLNVPRRRTPKPGKALSRRRHVILPQQLGGAVPDAVEHMRAALASALLGRTVYAVGLRGDDHLSRLVARPEPTAYLVRWKPDPIYGRRPMYAVGTPFVVVDVAVGADDLQPPGCPMIAEFLLALETPEGHLRMAELGDVGDSPDGDGWANESDPTVQMLRGVLLDVARGTVVPFRDADDPTNTDLQHARILDVVFDSDDSGLGMWFRAQTVDGAVRTLWFNDLLGGCGCETGVVPVREAARRLGAPVKELRAAVAAHVVPGERRGIDADVVSVLQRQPRRDQGWRRFGGGG